MGGYGYGIEEPSMDIDEDPLPRDDQNVSLPPDYELTQEQQQQEAMLHSYVDSLKKAIESGDEAARQNVFNHIFWFRTNFDEDYNARTLFHEGGAAMFLDFCNSLEKGVLTKLTTDYANRFLVHMKMSSFPYFDAQVKQLNEANNCSNSTLYHLGFGKVPELRSIKMKHALKILMNENVEENTQPPPPAVRDNNFAAKAAAAAARLSTNTGTKHEYQPINVDDQSIATSTMKSNKQHFIPPIPTSSTQQSSLLGSSAGSAVKSVQLSTGTKTEHQPISVDDQSVATSTAMGSSNRQFNFQAPEAKPTIEQSFGAAQVSTATATAIKPDHHLSFDANALSRSTTVSSNNQQSAPFVAAAATTSAFEGVVPPKGVPPSAPFAATPISQTPKSEWQSSTTSRTLQLERRQLFSTASRTHRRHNTPSHSTTQTSLKTPLPTANLQEVQTHLMTASRGESILENLYLEDAESAFGMNGDKWDTHRLMDLRDNFHPLFRELSNHRMFSKYLEKIESDPMFVVQMSRVVGQAEKHTGADSYIVTLNNQVKIVQNEQDEFSMRNGRINQIKNVASDKTTVLVEQSLHDTEEEVQNLIKQKEELDRERKEMNEVFDRKKKDVDRKIKELRGAYEKKKETFLHNENLNTVNAGKYEKNLVERNTIVKEENARRLAIPLARRKCDKMAMELLEQAMSLQDPSYGATDDDRVKFQKQKDDFFHFLNLVEVEDGDNVLIDEAFQLLYG